MHRLLKIILPVCICVFVLHACKNNKEALSAEEKKSISGSITKTLQQYYKDIKEKGLTAEFNYLDSSLEFFWVPPRYTSPISYDSVVTAIKKNANAFRTVSNSWEQLIIHPLTNELANYSGIIRSEMIDTSNKIGWKLLSGQTSIINK